MQSLSNQELQALSQVSVLLKLDVLALAPLFSGHTSEDNNKDDAGDDNLEGVLIILKNRKGTVIAPLSTNSTGD
jgi:hypothetical protein